MFNLSNFFNVKRDLEGGESAAAGGEAPATTEAATQTASLLSGGEAPATDAATDTPAATTPEPFLSALPEAGDAEGWAALYGKLGRPESAEGYELPLPEGDSGEFAKQTSTWMHEAGLNKQQAQSLATKWNEHQAAQAQAQQEAIQTQTKTDLASVRQEWGANFDANKSVMERAVNTFAPPEFIEMLDKSGLINNPAIAKMFLKIGSAINEDQSVAIPKNSPQGGEASLAQRLWPDMK